VNTRHARGLAANPVLVGAVTLLVILVAVFLSYNANSGLPFVPIYELEARLPNAANLVTGNEVRVGGARVGIVSEIEPVRDEQGKAVAQITMKLGEELDPLPVDSTLIVRPTSALGLKYVALTPGDADEGYAEGAVVPIAQARPAAVEIDEIFDMFHAPARRGAQLSLQGFGSGLAGRGLALNDAIVALAPLLSNLEPVMASLAAPSTRLDRLFRALGATAAEVAPVAETQAALFANLDVTFAALASVARPYIQDTISESPETFAVGARELPRQRPFVRNSTALLRELRPGIRTLPTAAPVLADALQIGTRTLPRTPPFNRQLADVFDSLAEFAEDPLVPLGVRRLRDTTRSLKPTLAFLTPAQTVCNYATLWFRNISSLLSEGDSNGTWQRFIIIAAPLGPDNEGGPSGAPADGPGADNHLHSNPYPNSAAPGQVRECEAGNEPYAVGRTVIGNVPGNQGTRTSGQVGAAAAGEGER
jgi:ABC-type transporter Mla subunit MlaD